MRNFNKIKLKTCHYNCRKYIEIGDIVQGYNIVEYCTHVPLLKYTVKCTPHIIISYTDSITLLLYVVCKFTKIEPLYLEKNL